MIFSQFVPPASKPDRIIKAFSFEVCRLSGPGTAWPWKASYSFIFLSPPSLAETPRDPPFSGRSGSKLRAKTISFFASCVELNCDLSSGSLQPGQRSGESRWIIVIHQKRINFDFSMGKTLFLTKLFFHVWSFDLKFTQPGYLLSILKPSLYNTQINDAIDSCWLLIDSPKKCRREEMKIYIQKCKYRKIALDFLIFEKKTLSHPYL